MSSAKITLYGMSKFYSDRGEDLFQYLTMPAGIDRDLLINSLILKGAEFEVLYSNGDFFREAIGTWSGKWQRTFKKWVDALNIEYRPLENYDRIEESEDKNTGTVENTGTQDMLSKVSAFNSITMQNSDQDTRTDNLTQTNNLKLEHTARLHGNIGVTTSQQMLQSELDIAYWNLYDHISDLFLQEFVVPIY